VREISLRNFHHKTEWAGVHGRRRAGRADRAAPGHAGYAVKVVEKENGILVAAKKGAANKFGYIFAHSAIIIILLGGMLDSDLPIQFQQWFFGKTPFAGSGVIADIPAQHRLGLGNPTYRGKPEDSRRPGRRHRDHSAGQRRAAARLAVHDTAEEVPHRFLLDRHAQAVRQRRHGARQETGKTFPATIKVNEPLIYKGVAVYQSSFEDGGTRLKLTGFPMRGAEQASFEIKGEVGLASPLKRGDEYTVEWSGFRPFNVENVNTKDARAVTKGEALGTPSPPAWTSTPARPPRTPTTRT
jgi:cytochrome c biogenesis protein